MFSDNTRSRPPVNMLDYLILGRYHNHLLVLWTILDFMLIHKFCSPCCPNVKVSFQFIIEYWFSACAKYDECYAYKMVIALNHVKGWKCMILYWYTVSYYVTFDGKVLVFYALGCYSSQGERYWKSTCSVETMLVSRKTQLTDFHCSLFIHPVVKWMKHMWTFTLLYLSLV